MKHILLVAAHNAFREALAVRLNQEEDLEVALHAGSLADTRSVHLNGIDVALVDPLLSDGDGLELVREMSVVNPNASPLVVSHRLDPAAHQQALGAGAAEVLNTNTSVEEVIKVVRRSAQPRE